MRRFFFVYSLPLLFFSNFLYAGIFADLLGLPNPSDSTRTKIQSHREDLRSLYQDLTWLKENAEKSGLKFLPVDLYWLELFKDKLIPQLEDDAINVVIGGGTNTGKSTLFNHLARTQLSPVSHKASATKHSVMAVSPRRAKNLAELQKLFHGLEIHSERGRALADQAVPGAHQLFVKTVRSTPDEIRVVDSADVDSVERSNWQKARQVARIADVLVAVITGQKYRDEAVVSFFKEAVDSGKPLIVIINHITEDEIRLGYWKDWLKEFADDMGKASFRTFLCPSQTQNSTELNFYEVYSDGRLSHKGTQLLRHAVQSLEVRKIKESVLIGSVVSALTGLNDGEKKGAVQFLELLKHRAETYRKVDAMLTQQTSPPQCQWPCAPSPLFVESLKQWWVAYQQTGMARTASQIGGVLAFPIQALWKMARGEPPSPSDGYYLAQDALIAEATSLVFQTLAQLPAETFSLEARGHLSPMQQTATIQALQRTLRSKPLKAELDQILKTRLDRWAKENPLGLAMLKDFEALAQVLITGSFAAGISSVTAGLARGAPIVVAGAQAIASRTLTTSAALGTMSSASLGAAASDAVTSKIGEWVVPQAFKEVLEDVQKEYQTAFQEALKRELFKIYAEIESRKEIDQNISYKNALVCSQKLLQGLKE